RFAPSPTGYLHIGGARTALFSWLYARQKGGTFVLRIEDTDRERSTPENTEVILDALRWLGLDWDEGPFFQTERMDLYKRGIEDLLARGHAYRCTCTAEALDAKREAALAAKQKPMYDRTCRDRADAPDQPHTIRFKAPLTGTTVVHDRILGDVEFKNEELDDLIIARTDGIPTYNFVVVMDDVDMRITDVIRGADHLNNTARQMQIYAALGAPLPAFAHLPLILGPDGSRLSKRHGATSVTAYRDEGYLPDGMINYLARLGWSHDDKTEIFSREDLVRLFSLEKVNKSNAKFDPDKLKWLNGHYIQSASPQELNEHLLPHLQRRGLQVPAWGRFLDMVRTLQGRAKTLEELVEFGHFYFTDEIAYDEKAAAKFLKPDLAEPLAELRAGLDELADFGEAGIEQVFTALCERRGLKLGKIAQPVRVALTGVTVSPGIYEMIHALGKEKTLERLERAIAHVRAA
ncbi:MAG: glutamate--tRNA ligase, partial [Myxococcales bacterium]|nr:glutamate--tRNA ligase [Myxococcales bacterium]